MKKRGIKPEEREGLQGKTEYKDGDLQRRKLVVLVRGIYEWGESNLKGTDYEKRGIIRGERERDTGRKTKTGILDRKDWNLVAW